MPRPRKKQDGKITTVYLERWALEKIMKISRDTGLSLGDLIEVWLTKEERVVHMVAEYEGLKKRVLELEKEKRALLEERDKLLEKVEKLYVERDALREENKALKEKIAELKKTARERKIEDLKAEVYQVLERYGKNGMKMIDFLKKLGYTSNFDMHAKEFLEQWFVEEKYKLISEELGLVVEKDPHFGRLAWIVKRIDSFRFEGGKLAEVEADV